MLWQLLHGTSFSACLPDSQNASCRFVWWQVRQTPAFCAAVPYLIRLAGLAFAGSFKCSVASPWQFWHMLPLASFFAPCAVIRIDACRSSWQLAHIGVAPFEFGAGSAASAGALAPTQHSATKIALAARSNRIEHLPARR